MDWTTIIAAAITAAGAFFGVYYSNRKSASLLEYRMQQLENKVAAHNKVVERTFRLEESTALQDAEIKRINRRLEIVEERVAKQ